MVKIKIKYLMSSEQGLGVDLDGRRTFIIRREMMMLPRINTVMFV